MITIESIKPGKAAEPSNIRVKMISPTEEVRISVMMELCQCKVE